MPEHQPPSFSSEPPPPSDPGRWRGLGRKLLRAVFPYKIEPYAPVSDSPQLPVIEPETPFPKPKPAPKPRVLGEPSEQSTIITVVEEFNALHFTDPTANLVHPAATGGRLKVTKLHSFFTKMYLASGAGEHAGNDIAARLNVQESTIRKSAGQLMRFLPPSMFDYDDSAGSPLRLWFGDLSFATRKPSEEEISQLDKEKVNIRDCDHAIIATRHSRYYLPLEAAESILAARVIRTLQGMKQHRATADEIANAAWKDMPIAERYLFLEDTSFAFSDSQQIKEDAMEILSKLTNRLELTLQPLGEQFTLLDNDVTVTFNELPLSGKDRAGLRPILPLLPGQSKDAISEMLYELSSKKLPSEYIQTADNVLSAMHQNRPLEAGEAISMLNFITTRAGRYAIHAVAGEDVSCRAGEIERIHTYLKRHLGYSTHTVARANRTISGNKLVRRRSMGAIQLVSGNLPPTTKWYIGHEMEP